MHEEALFQDLRRKLQEIAEMEHADRITRVTLWIGALSHVSEATVRDRWPELVHGTAAEGARLQIELSEDTAHPRAQGLVLAKVDLASEPPTPPGPSPLPGSLMNQPGVGPPGTGGR